jgi:lysophospholipase L1-like esterase
MAQDWAGLNHFKAENANTVAITPNEKRVVFMGNSIFEGWVNLHPEFFAGKFYMNRGISGQTTPQMLVRFRADVIKLTPKVVVILAGTNDIAGNTGPSTLEMIMDNLISMAQLAKANGIKVILCSVLPAFDYPWKPGIQPAEKIVALNKLIKAYAAKDSSMIYLDFFSAMADEKNGMKAEYTTDGVHPNEAGYNVMEPLTEIAISMAFGGTNAVAHTTHTTHAIHSIHSTHPVHKTTAKHVVHKKKKVVTH